MKRKDRTPSVAFKQAAIAWNELLEAKLEQVAATPFKELGEETLWLKIYGAVRNADPERVQGLLKLFEKREAAGIAAPLLKDLSPPQDFERLDPYARMGLKVSMEWPLSWVKPEDREAFMEQLLDSNHVLLPQALEVLPRMLQQQISIRAPFTPERQAVFNGVYGLVKSRAENDDGSQLQRSCQAIVKKVEMSKPHYFEAVGSTYAEEAFTTANPA